LELGRSSHHGRQQSVIPRTWQRRLLAGQHRLGQPVRRARPCLSPAALPIDRPHRWPAANGPGEARPSSAASLADLQPGHGPDEYRRGGTAPFFEEAVTSMRPRPLAPPSPSDAAARSPVVIDMSQAPLLREVSPRTPVAASLVARPRARCARGTGAGAREMASAAGRSVGAGSPAREGWGRAGAG